ncbi:hypothetical protein BpHYR1_045771 [Brachionus plicatilis]|uniref:Uncharacterized protein n=1 Tax=Brachionus plicatilis TaxID=10195 RepID=A0A3M7RE83_BRAPC|nr:hypothetical protein BpHYR1_045771 [Brachionus plicatilis]
MHRHSLLDLPMVDMPDRIVVHLFAEESRIVRIYLISNKQDLGKVSLSLNKNITKIFQLIFIFEIFLVLGQSYICETAKGIDEQKQQQPPPKK